MKKLSLLLSFSLLPTLAHAEHPLAKNYLDGLFRAKPHLASFMGDHRFDNKLMDESPEALNRRKKELEHLASAFSIAPIEHHEIDNKVDSQIMRQTVALELLYLNQIREYGWDPRLYDSFPYYDPREIVASRLADLLHDPHLEEKTKRTSIVAQLKQLPSFLAQRKKYLTAACVKPVKRGLWDSSKCAPKVYAEQAIKVNAGRIDFFETELKKYLQGTAISELTRSDAVRALREYQTFLEKELLPVANGDWRLGAEIYGQKFPLALQTELTTDEAVKKAEQAFRDASTKLLEVAVKLHTRLWPREKLTTDAIAKSKKAIILRVKEELSKHHPAAQDLVASHGKNLGALRQFIIDKNLLALPPEATLSLEAMPEYKRGAAAAEYLSPGVLDRRPDWHATYYVDPVDPTWSAEKIESYLRGQNDYETQLTAAHEAYPGHHTQYFYSKRNLNPIRAVLWNAPMVEGWAVYGEGMMVEQGWGGEDNDRFRFYDLRGQMVAATNLIIDVKLQSGQMTDEEAIRFMVEEGYQEQGMAEKKLHRAKLDSTQLAQYFLGLVEIRQLESDWRAQQKGMFSQRSFNEALIGHGSIAIRHLRQYLLN